MSLRAIAPFAALVALSACDGGDGVKPPGPDTGDTYIPWPDDTDSEGTDNDGDGWTVEDGDCDDDNVWVNPGRPEEEDGIDNDCDGRVDEAFRGLVTLQENDYQDNIPGRVVGIDDFGETSWEVVLDNTDFWLHQLTEGVNGGFVVGTWADGRMDQKYPSSFTAIHDVDESGSMTVLADFGDADLYPLGMYGIATHPDGYYLVTTGDAIYSVEPDTGAVTQLAFWDFETEIAPFAVSVNHLTGVVGIYGFFGGFATIDEVGAVELLRVGNAETTQIALYDGQHYDLGGFYAIGQRSGSTDYEIMRYNEQQNDWVTRVTYSEAWNPNYMTIDSVNGGYYLSSGDATYPVVWKVTEEGDTSQFFLSPYLSPRMDLQGVYTLY